MILSISMAFANPTYYPTTTIAEDFGATWCGGCIDAAAGMAIMNDTYNSGEFFSVNYFTTSGDLSNAEVDARFTHYEVFGVPTVIFNGKTRMSGNGSEMADGTLFEANYQKYKFNASPLKIDIAQFTPTNGHFTGSVTMLSPSITLTNQNIYFLLMEDDVTTVDSRVTRSIFSQNISLTGENSVSNFDVNFTINPAWNQANLWAAVFVQLDNNTVLQAASTIPVPDHYLRAAFDWSVSDIGAPNTSYLGEDFYLFNLGLADTYNTRIVVDSAPEGWYFNYCEGENCYPGSILIPHSLAAGEVKGFHLNLSIGASGLAIFHFEVTSPNIGTMIIPFRIHTSDYVANDDVLITSPIRMGKNFPNPFNRETKIQVFADKGNSNATIDIYNIKGQLVKSITHHNLSSGANEITLKLDQSEASSLSSGVYYYCLQGSTEPARKMLMLKQ
jgi:thiol-disulfide isomerase/thioredoxin